MTDLLQEMLFCQSMLVCESYDCRNFFEFDELACEPMDAWSVRATAEAKRCGWAIGHTGLVKCPECSAAAR